MAHDPMLALCRFDAHLKLRPRELQPLMRVIYYTYNNANS